MNTATIPRKNKKGIKAAPASRAGRLEATQAERRNLYIAVAALLAVVFVCFANALVNGFVFDDINHILKVRSLRDVGNIPRMLTESYRPIRDISYALDFAVWGERAFGFHLTNLLIHVANTLLVFFLIRRLTAETLVAALAALIFAVHPLQTDAVTYVSGRRDILFTLFYLASFSSYLKYRRSRSVVWLGMFLLFWALGLMSKEMAATLPLFIFAWNFCESWPKGERSFPARFVSAARAAFVRDKWLYIALTLMVPAYAYYAIFVKGGSIFARAGEFNYWGGNFFTNALTVICVHAWYLKQLVLPTPIVQYLGAFHIATSLFDWRVIVSLVVVGAVFASSFLLIKKHYLMAFAILSYFIVLLPVSHIIPHHELLADHYLYLPMMSFGLFVALAARNLSARGERARRFVYAGAILVVIVFSVMTVLRNRVWKDEMSLWQANYQEAPGSIRAVSSLAGLYANRNPQKAIELYKRCIEIEPSFAPAYLSLAVLLQNREKAREAESIIQQGLAIPDHQVTSRNVDSVNEFRSQLKTALAMAKGNQGDTRRAEELLLEAINIDPSKPQPYVLLATLYNKTDRRKELDILKRQISIDPDPYAPLQTLSFRLIEDKKYDEAVPYLERMLAIDAKDFYANCQLAQVYRTRQDCNKAQAYLAIAQSSATTPEQNEDLQSILPAFRQQCP